MKKTMEYFKENKMDAEDSYSEVLNNFKMVGSEKVDENNMLIISFYIVGHLSTGKVEENVSTFKVLVL